MGFFLSASLSQAFAFQMDLGTVGMAAPTPASPRPCSNELGHDYFLKVPEIEPGGENSQSFKRKSWQHLRNPFCPFSYTPMPPPLHPGLHAVSPS
jgi:hypothetical protein